MRRPKRQDDLPCNPKSEIEICLNCAFADCTYPDCGKQRNVAQMKRGPYKRSKLRDYDKGEALRRICELARQGKKRKEIAAIFDARKESIDTLIRNAVKKGLLTQEEADATKVCRKENTWEKSSASRKPRTNRKVSLPSEARMES